MPHDQFDRLRARGAGLLAPRTRRHRASGRSRSTPTCRACSHDSDTFSSELGGTFIPSQDEEALAQIRLTILNMDPPKHNRYRRLVSKGFTPRMIGALVEDDRARGPVASSTTCARRARCEFVEEIAAQVPVQMICEMIGLEPEVWPRMFELSNQLIGSRDDPDYQELRGADERAAMEVYALCDAVAADRRAHPRDDIMTALVHAEIDGERLDDAELNLFFITLIVAGNETTRNLINHSMLALIEHPDQAQRLRDDPSLWDTAVEEMLRWGSSIHNFRRTATRTPSCAACRSRRATRSSSTTRRPTATRRCSTTPTASTSGAPRTTTSPSAAAASTSASAPAWPAPRSAPTMRQLVDRLPDLELAGPAEPPPLRLRQRHQDDARPLHAHRPDRKD